MIMNNENTFIFFLIWTAVGFIYYLAKVVEYKEIYENENIIGKALTVFLGGPLTMLYKLFAFLVILSTTKINLFNKTSKKGK